MRGKIQKETAHLRKSKTAWNFPSLSSDLRIDNKVLIITRGISFWKLLSPGILVFIIISEERGDKYIQYEEKYEYSFDRGIDSWKLYKGRNQKYLVK